MLISGTNISHSRVYSTPIDPPLNYSVAFDGSTSYMTAPLTPYNFAPAGNFTIEAWVYLTGTYAGGPYYILSNWPSGSIAAQTFNFGVNASGYLQFYAGIVDTQLQVIGSSQLVPINQWNHVSISRSGSTFKIFVNGVQDSTTATNSGALNVQSTSYKLGIGHRNDSGSYYYGWKGYISNLRFVDGTALYTTTFTPPTSPLIAITGTKLLTCQSTTIQDNSPNALTITNTTSTVIDAGPFPANYSVLFDGNNDYLTTPTSTGFGFGSTTPFTFEAWVYPTANPAGGPGTIIDCRNSASAQGWVVKLLNNLTFGFLEGVTGTWVYSSGTYTLNAWNHIAVVKVNDSTNGVKLYLNGVASGTGTLYNDLGTTWPARIGQSQDYVDYNGYISNLRVVKGTAVYTGAFTPATRVLSAISGTSLLVAQSPTIIDNSTNALTITVNGNAVVSSKSPF